MLSNDSFKRKSTKSSGSGLKNVYTEQLNKLQQRHQQESDLLEDLRLFAKQRSVIEKEYAQALCKLAQQFMTKRPFPAPLGGSEEGKDYKTMHEVWQTVLEETDRVGKVRLLAADTYLLQISEPCKPVRSAKAQIAKKVFENLMELQKEVSLSVQDVTKLQKVYKDEEHVAHDSRLKAADADDKVKRKSVGLFTSMSKLQQQSSKLNLRREACESKSTAARNDYILSLAAANAHVQRYYSKDTPELMKTLDGDVHERMQEYFTLFSQAELHSCGVTQECFMKILSDATKINRPYNLQRFLSENAVFTDVVKYEFQPQDSDPITKVVQDSQLVQALEAEAKRCASRAVREDRHINSFQRKVQQLSDQQAAAIASRSAADATIESSAAHSTAISDLEIKMEDLRQSLRKAQIEKVKAEARLESLKEGGINVDSFLAAANTEAFTPEEEELPTPTTTSAAHVPSSNRNSVLGKSDSTASKPAEVSSRPTSEHEEASVARSSSTKTSSQGAVTATAPNGSTYINYQDEDECIDDAFESSGGAGGAPSHAARLGSGSTGYVSTHSSSHSRCMALYTFQGTNADELDMTENEQLEVVAEAEGDGWIRVRNSAGKVGLVPETYIQLSDSAVEASAVMPPPPPPPLAPEEYTAPTTDIWGPPDPALIAEAVHSEQRSSANYSSTDYEVQEALSPPTNITADGSMWARALYDYYATTDEELTFMEGSLIRITRKQLHEGVDDGWWEGEFNGKTGTFPSLVVEELTSETQELASPQRPGPPDFAPPPPAISDPAINDPHGPHLNITLPTPSEEDGGGIPSTEDLQDYEERNKENEPEPFVPPPELEKFAADLQEEVECCHPANHNVIEVEVHADPDADHVTATDQAPPTDDESFPDPPTDFDENVPDGTTSDSLC